MAKNGSAPTHEATAVGDAVDEGIKTLIERGRAAADHLPDAVDAAQSQLDLLSDKGVIGAVGFSIGVTTGLFLAGAPRPILAVSMVPLAITVRAALTRGVRLSRLVRAGAD
jgi:hypothetical protein